MSVSGAVGDHHGGGVDRRVAHDPLEPLGDVDDLMRGRRRESTSAAQRLARRQAVLEVRRTTLIGSGISFASLSPSA